VCVEGDDQLSMFLILSRGVLILVCDKWRGTAFDGDRVLELVVVVEPAVEDMGINQRIPITFDHSQIIIIRLLYTNLY